MRGDEMPDGLPVPDQLCFIGLRSLYAQVRHGTISRDAGSREKGRMLHEKYLLEQKLRTKERIAQRSAELFRTVECAANRYAKDRTLENADALYEAIYRVPVTR